MQNESRPRWKLLVVLLAPLLRCLLGEFGLRRLLFGEGELEQRWGKPWRVPVLFTDAATEDYWILSQRWLNEPGPLPAERLDPALGWLGSDFRRDGWRHVDEERLGGRRPVLLRPAALRPEPEVSGVYPFFPIASAGSAA